MYSNNYQSLIREFKKTQKEKLRSFSKYANIIYPPDIELSTKFLFQSISSDANIYTLALFETDLDSYTDTDPDIGNNRTRTRSKPIDIQNPAIKMPDKTDNSMNNYLGSDGFIHNTYNAELCDKEWMIFIFSINMFYYAFTCEKVKIKSLHINCSTSVLSAINHFLFNSTVGKSKLGNSEWKWLFVNSKSNIKSNIQQNSFSGSTCSFSGSSCSLSGSAKIMKKYQSNILNVIESNISSINNINFIINETSTKLNKINLLVVCKLSDIKTYIMYAVLIAKLMELNSIFYIKVPNIDNWDTQFVNILLLYSFLFEEIYIYKYNLTDLSTYLICKNRKKINNEILYKKLIDILVNPLFTNKHNLFNESVFTNFAKSWLKKINDIIINEINENDEIKLDTILTSIETLTTNINNFL